MRVEYRRRPRQAPAAAFRRHRQEGAALRDVAGRLRRGVQGPAQGPRWGRENFAFLRAQNSSSKHFGDPHLCNILANQFTKNAFLTFPTDYLGLHYKTFKAYNDNAHLEPD